MVGPWSARRRKRSLKVLDVSSGKVLWKQPLPQQFLGQLAFSPDGNYLLAWPCGRPNNQIRMVESATGKTVYTISHVPADHLGPFTGPFPGRQETGMWNGRYQRVDLGPPAKLSIKKALTMPGV